MREVRRDSVTVPDALAAVDPAAIAAVRSGQEASGSIYRHASVVASLRRLYLDKCFLCESPVGAQGVVEHFLPWHASYPDRAYDWANLHWSCDPCNQRKKRHPWRVPPQSKFAATRTVLLDPTALPAGKTVAELLTFGANLRAKVGREGIGVDEAEKTAEFLNEGEAYSERVARFGAMMCAVAEAGKRDSWVQLVVLDEADLLRRLQSQRDPDDLAAADKADGLYQMFLAEESPQSFAMRELFELYFRIPVSRIQRLSRCYRCVLGLDQAVAPVAHGTVTAGSDEKASESSV